MIALAVVSSLAVVLVALAYLARRIRRSGRAGPAIGAAMAAYDEAMHPAAFTAFVDIRAQDDRTIARPAPENPVRKPHR